MAQGAPTLIRCHLTKSGPAAWALIAAARQKGRSWQEIGPRPGMTADEAEQAYRESGEEGQQSPGWRHAIAVGGHENYKIADTIVPRW